MLRLMWKLYLLYLEGLLWKSRCMGRVWLGGFPRTVLELPLNLLAVCCSSIKIYRLSWREKDFRKKRVTLSLKGCYYKPCFHFISPSLSKSFHLFLLPNAVSTLSVPVHAWFHLIRLSTVAGIAAWLTTKNQSCISSQEVCFLLDLINQWSALHSACQWRTLFVIKNK